MSSTIAELCATHWSYQLLNYPHAQIASRCTCLMTYVCLRALLCYVEGICQPLIITIKRTMPNVSNVHRNNCWPWQHARIVSRCTLHDIFYATLYERKIMLWNNPVKENTHIWLHSVLLVKYAIQSRSYIQPNDTAFFHAKYCKTYSRTFFESLTYKVSHTITKK